MYIDVAVSDAKDQKKDFFTYFSSRQIPKGTLVSVPFGKKTVSGVVFANKDTSALTKVLPILRVSYAKPIITQEQMSFFEQVARYYHTSVSLVLSLALPKLPAAVLKSQPQYPYRKEVVKQTLVLAPSQKFLHELEVKLKNKTRDYLIYHGDLSIKERAETYMRVLHTAPKLIIATKVGLFLPFTNLKYIYVYEEHDWAYKEQRSPRYHAQTVAKLLADTTNADLTIKDNTPRVETFYAAAKNKTKISLAKTFPNLKPPTMHFVNIPIEKRQGNEFLVTETLAAAIKDNLKNRQPILLYLNKKNDGGFLRCQACEMSVYVAIKPAICPNCKKTAFIFDIINLKQVAATINRYLKLWGVTHANWDSTYQGSMISLIIGEKVRLVVATQKVLYVAPLFYFRLLGVITADSILDLPEFRAHEKTFATLTQLTTLLKPDAQAVIQTRNIDHPIFRAFAKLDYPSFVKSELIERKSALYPPFAKLILCSFSAKTPQTLNRNSQAVSSALERYIKNHPYSAESIEIVGPYPRLHDPLEIRILLKSRDQEVLQHVLSHIPSTWKVDFDPENIVT